MRGTLPLAILLVACTGDVILPKDPSTTQDPDDITGARKDGGPGDGDEGEEEEDEEEENEEDAGKPSNKPDAQLEDDEFADGPCAAGTESLVEQLGIQEIALYQALKIPLARDGQWLSERAVPVVQGKESLVRVFVEPMSGFSPHALRAVLSLDNAGKITKLEAALTPRAASSDADLASTFNFEVAPELVTADTELSVSVVEPICDPKRGENPTARFPASGTQALEATKVGVLRVVLVPVQTGQNVPPTDAAQVTAIRDALLAHYPVPAVDVQVADPLVWDREVTAAGGGWTELLNQVRRRRQLDAVAKDVYYFGLVNPQSTLRTYCSGGCVLGMAPQTTYVSSADQVGLGVGFVDANTYTTVVHELGHAHGRGHAPCVPRGGSIQGVDSGYPKDALHTGGATGIWGWDSRDGALQPPTTKDVMGYCEPAWISDYTYSALAERASVVNTTVQPKRAGPVDDLGPWHSLILYGDGTARWAGLVIDETPVSAREPLRVFDAQGRLLAELEAVRVGLDHGSDSFLYIPKPGADWAVIELSGGQRIALSSVLPALP